MKKFLLMLIISVLAINTKAQEYNYFNLIGKKKIEIKKSMKATSGIIKVDKFIGGFIEEPPHTQLLYVFPPSSVTNNGMYSAWFMLTKNDRCYKYIIWYTKDEFKSRVIQNIQKAGFVRIGNKLQWKNSDIKIEIDNVKSGSPDRQTAFTVLGELVNKN